ncbi:hypothetical protein N7462_006460 [Penicillium macrosclerotiorum]|uniref:uncharacterized protein n=1 Tax=Penicillium macrosclerotiorum TaxID=303699 RepID=UPI002547334E|nr:uncharacterized protein N7462_006460 [Penicillium macrosclerotiorum]KAJ5683295.1 hypothetical protein N7462_006460 [Penicillium macrosclerotiorum]
MGGDENLNESKGCYSARCPQTSRPATRPIIYHHLIHHLLPQPPSTNHLSRCLPCKRRPDRESCTRRPSFQGASAAARVPGPCEAGKIHSFSKRTRHRFTGWSERPLLHRLTLRLEPVSQSALVVLEWTTTGGKKGAGLDERMVLCVGCLQVDNVPPSSSPSTEYSTQEGYGALGRTGIRVDRGEASTPQTINLAGTMDETKTGGHELRNRPAYWTCWTCWTCWTDMLDTSTMDHGGGMRWRGPEEQGPLGSHEWSQRIHCRSRVPMSLRGSGVDKSRRDLRTPSKLTLPFGVTFRHGTPVVIATALSPTLQGEGGESFLQRQSIVMCDPGPTPISGCRWRTARLRPGESSFAHQVERALRAAHRLTWDGLDDLDDSDSDLAGDTRL